METTTSEHYRTTPPQPRKFLRFFSVKGLFIVAIFVILCGGFILGILRNESFQITGVSVSGTETFSDQVISDAVYAYLSGNYAKVIPRSTTILFSKNTLEQWLKREFPIIDFAYVTFTEPQSIHITLKEKEPDVVWCFTGNECGFVDSVGVVYGRAPEFSEGVYTTFSREQSSTLHESLGKQIITADDLVRFKNLFQQLQSTDIIISRVVFLENSDIAFTIEKLFDRYPKDGVAILGTIGQDDQIFLRDVQVGLTHDVFKKQYLQSPKNLEYIDLRFPGKVFYKFIGNEQPLEKINEQGV